MKRKSFNISLEWKDKLKGLPVEVRVEVYDAIMEYAESGTLLDLKPMAKLAFSFIKPDMDLEIERINSISKKRAEAGRKAMEKRYGASDIKEQQSVTNDNKSNKCNQVIANDSICYQELDENQPINNNIINNLSDIEERKETTTKVVEKKREKSAAKAAPTDIENRKKEFYETLRPYLAKYPKETLRRFFDYWSEMNKSCTKMRFELEKTWEVSKRLATWANRDKTFNNSMEIGTVLHDNSTDKYNNEEKWVR